MQEFTYTTTDRDEFRAQIKAVVDDNVDNNIKKTGYDHDTGEFCVIYEAEAEVTQ